MPGTETIPEESPVRHYSSSSEDGAELDGSMISYRQNRASTSPARTMSKARSLVNKLNFMSPPSPVQDSTIWTADTSYAYDTRFLFKRRVRDLYSSLSSLKSYIEINYSGFRKILKKWVGICDLF